MADVTYSYHASEFNWRSAWPQIVAVGVKNILLVAYGMTLGFAAIVIPAVSDENTNDIHLDKEQISWFSSINLIVVPFGCFASGFVTDSLGRRTVMRLCNLPFMVSWLLYYFADSVTFLYTALIITGTTGGLLEAPVLTYVAEITQPHLRGMLSATSSLSVIFGIFIQFLNGSFCDWRTTALINLWSPVLALFALCFVPESPHWLIAHGKYEEAKKSLRWLRGWTTEENIISEYNDLFRLIKGVSAIPAVHEGVVVKKTIKENIRTFTRRSFLEPIVLVSLIFFLGHFCGMTTLQTYAVYLFDLFGTPIDKFLAALILGIVQLLGALTCVILVHIIGKRKLTFISTIGTAFCCIMVGMYARFLLEQNNNENSWVPVSFLILLAFLSHTGIRLLPWILIGEVFTTETRSLASGFASGFGYVFNFLANKYFLAMIDGMSLAGTYWFYGAVILFGTVVFYFYLPETEGKTLAEIENHFSGKKKLTNEVAKTQRLNMNNVELCNVNKAGIDNIVFSKDINTHKI